MAAEREAAAGPVQAVDGIDGGAGLLPQPLGEALTGAVLTEKARGFDADEEGGVLE